MNTHRDREVLEVKADHRDIANEYLSIGVSVKDIIYKANVAFRLII